MTILTSDTPYLAGHLLVAMPGMTDPRFTKTVIYLCAHNEEGAMGLVINQPMEDLTFPDLLEQLGMFITDPAANIEIQTGGPVEQGRGFVLHSPDYLHDTSMVVDESVVMTGTLDILRAIAEGHGPKRRLLALGYAGWGPGQLDREILQNGWLSVPADPDIVFDDDLEHKWLRALAKLGIDLSLLSEEAGHA
ncbi:MAG: YqgE/AlgH family protein [Alphaproteobacteria bacterium]|nr:YqgE/AlgH family protein [Alphaproteobacteria bacterium]MBF0249849.1 YqgE/AlgH family protein [Alphaproteobacteria bacterium]